jgi:hypothetical protein
MPRTFKSIFLAIASIIIISFILPGCYTQFARPRVNTDDQNYVQPEDQQADEYYQDEGTPADSDSKDVYIYNYYPFYGPDYYDYWYWNSYPYHWGYLGPYPDYWWDPYGHWWRPGWYVGFSYYNYYGWGGHSRHYHSYYGHSGGGSFTAKDYSKRPFDRRSIGGIDRGQRMTDSPSSLAKPQGPTRVERPGQTLSKPDVRNRTVTPDQRNRTVREMVDQRLRDKANPTKRLENERLRKSPDKRPVVTKPGTNDNPPRQSKMSTKPGVIEKAPSNYVPSRQKRSTTNSKSSSNQKSSTKSRSSNPNKKVSKSSTPSYSPKSSSHSSSRSTSPRSSSGHSRSSRGSSSKSSGSSRKSR